MDTVSAALLLAVAGGAGGAVGEQTWRALVALVHRPAHDTPSQPDGRQPDAGALLDRLGRHPDEVGTAEELAAALTARAGGDPAFHADLEAWSAEAHHLHHPAHRPGVVHNTVTGGTFHGPVVQAGGSVHLDSQTPPSRRQA